MSSAIDTGLTLVSPALHGWAKGSSGGIRTPSGRLASLSGARHRLGPVAGRIRDADIVQVRDRANIEDIVGEYVALRRAGAGSLKGLCPFHDEKSPSLNVRPSHGTFHCFGCGEGGSVIDFVMKIEHLGFVEA